MLEIKKIISNGAKIRIFRTLDLSCVYKVLNLVQSIVGTYHHNQNLL